MRDKVAETLTVARSKRPTWTKVAPVVVAWLLVHGLYALFSPVLESWDLQALDRLTSMRASRMANGETALDPNLICVALDQDSLEAIGSGETSREWAAQSMRALAAAGARTQVWDIVFEHSRGEDDGGLDEAAATAGNVVLANFFATFDRRADGSVVVGAQRASFEALRAGAAGEGHINLLADGDGTIRRLPLVVRDGEAWTPALPLAGLCHYLDVPLERVDVSARSRVVLRDARLPGAAAPSDLTIPVDPHGFARVDLLLPWESIEVTSIDEIRGDVLDYPDVWREVFAGKIVMVGDITQQGNDIGVVPTDPRYPLLGVQLSFANSVLRGSVPRDLRPGERMAVEAILLLILGVSAWRFGLVGFVVVAVATAVSWIVAASVGFVTFGLVASVVRPTLLIALSIAVVLGHRYLLEAQARAHLRRTFESYFPATVVAKLMNESASVIDTRDKKVLTVLFSDVVNFTRNTVDRDPLEIQASLSVYFEAMVDIVFEHGGTVDKFMGDGLLVFFGDPMPQDDHAQRAVRAAIAMQRKVRQLDREWRERGWMPLCIRVGIHTDAVVVGNMGSPRRMTYTVLGAGVNLAARIESGAPPGEILVSEATHDAMGGSSAFPSREHGEIDAKGFDDRVRVWLIESGS